MGNRNLVAKSRERRAKSGELSLMAMFLAVMVFCPAVYTLADSSEPTSDTIENVFEDARLREKADLTGATLKEIIGTNTELSGLKQIALKTYENPTPPGDAEIEALFTAYETRLVDQGWQSIFLRRDRDRTVYIYGKEKEGIREKLLIVLITPSEISEMVLIGEMELSALSELRRIIMGSLPTLDAARPMADLFDTNSSPSQQVRDAIRKLEDKITAKDDQVSLEDYFRLATAYQHVGEDKKALASYGFVLEHPNAPEWMMIRAYQGSAESSERLGKINDAKMYYDMMIRDFSEQTDIVASAQVALKRLDLKSSCTAPIVKTPMEKAEDMLYAHGEYQKAIDMYQEIIDSAPDDPDAKSALYMLGMAYGYADQEEKQIETFVEAASKYPGPVSYIYLARAYQNVGAYEEALGHYRMVIDLYPDSAEATDAYLAAGECSEALGMVEEAKGYYMKLAEKFKNDERPGILAEKALIRMERGDDRPFLGLGFRFTESMSKGGVPIVTVFKNGPCKAAGVQRGDVLLAIDSQPTHNARDVIGIIGWEKNIGDEVTLLIQRRGGEREVTETQVKRTGGKEVEIPTKLRYETGEFEIPVTLIATPEKLER